MNLMKLTNANGWVVMIRKADGKVCDFHSKKTLRQSAHDEAEAFYRSFGGVAVTSTKP
jgi:hypothetical protein